MMSALRAGGRQVRRPAKVTPARWVAWQVVRRTFDEGAWTDRAFTGESERAGLQGRERALAQRLAWGTVQRARRLDHVIGSVGKRPLRKIDPPVLHALRIGVYELLEHTGSEHAAVDQAVEIVRAAVGERAVAFANAVLRRAQVDGAAILAALDPDDPADRATQLSFPEWMVRRMHAAFGADGLAALAAQNEPASVTPFRVNSLHPASARAAASIERAGGQRADDAPPLSLLLPEAVVLGGSTAAVEQLVADGLLVPQSLASMLVGHVLDTQPGERVLDMCAAPGGKTTHIAALMDNDGSVLACDLHPHRVRSISALAARCRATIVTTRVADARALDPERDGQFDRVLVDAPCSGLGVLGRRPDARWKRTESSIDELASLQQQLLATAARMVRPGGAVVYSTCTLLPEENEDVVGGSIDAGLELRPDPLGQELAPLLVEHAPWMARTWPQRDATDGFFIARLRRSDAGPA